MIRFSCDTCGRTLRAPASMAGKRGKCARCGGVNRVPEVLSVDVKRAPEASPFRNADLPAGSAIVGAIELAESKFLTTPAGTRVSVREPGGDFYEQVAGRLDGESQEGAATGTFVSPAPVPGNGAQEAPVHRPMDGLAPHASDYEFQLDSHSSEISRAIAAALVVGAVVGFCAGLLASKWIL